MNNDGCTKISQLDYTRLVDKDIGCFDITMNDTIDM